jgi:hypothetical protein
MRMLPLLARLCPVYLHRLEASWQWWKHAALRCTQDIWSGNPCISRATKTITVPYIFPTEIDVYSYATSNQDHIEPNSTLEKSQTKATELPVTEMTLSLSLVTPSHAVVS